MTHVQNDAAPIVTRWTAKCEGCWREEKFVLRDFRVELTDEQLDEEEAERIETCLIEMGWHVTHVHRNHGDMVREHRCPTCR